MITVSVEVNSGGACFSVDVSANSIEGAIKLAGRRYPGYRVRVIFPIEPETFFTQPKATMDRAILADVYEGVSNASEPTDSLMSWRQNIAQTPDTDPSIPEEYDGGCWLSYIDLASQGYDAKVKGSVERQPIIQHTVRLLAGAENVLYQARLHSIGSHAATKADVRGYFEHAGYQNGSTTTKRAVRTEECRHRVQRTRDVPVSWSRRTLAHRIQSLIANSANGIEGALLLLNVVKF